MTRLGARDEKPSGGGGADNPLCPGLFVTDHIQLLRPLGEGGMGSVWVAHHHVLDVHVAIKFVRMGLGSPITTERLKREARAVARLSHPAVVRVLEFGEGVVGGPFIVMELLEGETLAELLLREGWLDAIRGVELLWPIADALAVAHTKGMIHRDLKPTNVFLARDERGRIQPKLLDFGIVRLGGASRLTDESRIVGTPGYAAPEVAAGEQAIDPRADVWAFSLVLYETLTGVQPFARDSTMESLRSVLGAEPPVIGNLTVGDAALGKIIARGLRVDRNARWQNMRDLADALEAWLGSHGVRVSATPLSTESLSKSRPRIAESAASLAPTEMQQPAADTSEPPSPFSSVQTSFIDPRSGATRAFTPFVDSQPLFHDAKSGRTARFEPVVNGMSVGRVVADAQSGYTAPLPVYEPSSGECAAIPRRAIPETIADSSDPDARMEVGRVAPTLGDPPNDASRAQNLAVVEPLAASPLPHANTFVPTSAPRPRVIWLLPILAVIAAAMYIGYRLGSSPRGDTAQSSVPSAAPSTPATPPTTSLNPEISNEPSNAEPSTLPKRTSQKPSAPRPSTKPVEELKNPFR